MSEGRGIDSFGGDAPVGLFVRFVRADCGFLNET